MSELQVLKEVYDQLSECQDNLPLARNEVYICTVQERWYFLPAIPGLRSKRYEGIYNLACVCTDHSSAFCGMLAVPALRSKGTIRFIVYHVFALLIHDQFVRCSPSLACTAKAREWNLILSHVCNAHVLAFCDMHAVRACAVEDR